MINRDKIEYYGGNNLVASVISSMVPAVDSLINIRNVTWKITNVTYALDHSNDNDLCGMRANVDIKKC